MTLSKRGDGKQRQAWQPPWRNNSPAEGERVVGGGWVTVVGNKKQQQHKKTGNGSTQYTIVLLICCCWLVHKETNRFLTIIVIIMICNEDPELCNKQSVCFIIGRLRVQIQMISQLSMAKETKGAKLGSALCVGWTLYSLYPVNHKDTSQLWASMSSCT